MIDTLDADAYFDEHLSKAKWGALTQDVKAAAIKEASRIIAGELDGMELDPEEQNHVAAVAEEALYLASGNAPQVNDIMAGALVSESVDGIGSATYTAGRRNPFLCAKAKMYVDLIRMSSGSIRIMR